MPPRTGNTPQAHTTEDTTDTEEDMGLYDTPVPPFTDLRKEGAVTRGRRKVGKNGIDPKYVEDVERVIDHFTSAHRAVGTKFRVTDAWYADIQAMLRGTDAMEPFTADQICDLIDFGIQNAFWHSHITNPSGLRRHGPKLFGGDDYITWSLANKRPAANRPRNTLVKGASAPGPVKGRIHADEKWTDDDYGTTL